jgi:surface polysaccharide O-acyltransferase-like enzyme
LVGALQQHPAWFFVALVAASAIAYIPLALVFMPWEWTHYGPFSYQLARPLHYLVYFFAGFAIGAYGLDRGLLAVDGALARQWVFWVIAAFMGWGLWAAPTSVLLDDSPAPVILQIAAGLGYALACASGCFALMAVCLRFLTERARTLDSLSANAYGMYLVHYVFVVWLQFALLDVALPAVPKAAIVFLGTLVLSWTIAGTAGVPLGTTVAGVKR